MGVAGKVGIKGISDFGIQDLSIHGVHNTLLIAAPLSRDDAQTYEQLDQTRAEHVFVRNCYVFQEPIYGRSENRSPHSSWSRRAAMAFRGDDISVTDCDIKGAGAAVGFMGCRYTQLARNRLYQGHLANGFCARGDEYPSQPLQGRCVFEDNTIIPVSGDRLLGL